MSGTEEIAGLRVLVRGWLHGNVIRVGRDLVDSGYHSGTDALIAWIDGPVDRLYLTHVHSDHAGGVAALRERGGLTVFAHPDAQAIVEPWDPRALWLEDTGQELPRFAIDASVQHGEAVEIGDRSFRVVHTPGHATGGVVYVDADGVMIAGDALWERGFGTLNPWIDGEGVFADAALALDRIEAAGPRVVIPGHGRPFTEVSAALDRARILLEQMRDPDVLLERAMTSSVGFWALTDPRITGQAIRERLVANGVPADAPWIEPLLQRLGR